MTESRLIVALGKRVGRRDDEGAQVILRMLDMFVILTGDGFMSVYIFEKLIN